MNNDHSDQVLMTSAMITLTLPWPDGPWCHWGPLMHCYYGQALLCGALKMCIFYRVLMIGKHSLLVKFSGKIRFPDFPSLLCDNCYRRQTTSVMMERVRFVFVLTCIHNTHVSALDIQGYLTGIIYKSMCAHTCVYMGWYTSVTRLHGTMV